MSHVVVVGAGIGGLAATLVMSRIASQVTLGERSERPSEVGAACEATSASVLGGAA